MSVHATTPRPPLPQPIAWLYAIAVLVALLSAGAAVWVGLLVGFDASLTFTASMAGVAIGAFVPALLGHGIVVAVHDTVWQRRG